MKDNALQNFVVFCQTSTCISHRYTFIPSLLNLPPISLSMPLLWVDTEPLFEFPEPYSKFLLDIYFMSTPFCSMICLHFLTTPPWKSIGDCDGSSILLTRKSVWMMTDHCWLWPNVFLLQLFVIILVYELEKVLETGLGHLIYLYLNVQYQKT